MGKFVFWLACVLLLVVANGSASGAENQLSDNQIGELEPIEDISDPKYQSLGKLLVEMHNWQVGSHLLFLKVQCGWFRIVEGTEYVFCLLLIDEDNDDAKVIYKTTAYVDLSRNISISDFHIVTNFLCCPLKAKA